MFFVVHGWTIDNDNSVAKRQNKKGLLMQKKILINHCRWIIVGLTKVPSLRQKFLETKRQKQKEWQHQRQLRRAATLRANSKQMNWFEGVSLK